MVKNSIKYLVAFGQAILRGLIGFGLAVGIVFALQWFYYVHLDGYNLPTIVEPIDVLNEGNKVKLGDTIEMLLIIDKPEEIPIKEASVDITCIGGNLITMSSSGRTIPPGQYEVISTTYVMPPKANPGDICQFNYRNIYQPNPYVTTEQITWSSEVFKVVE